MSKYLKELYSELEDERSSQIGNGERGNKKRTYRVKDNVVIDHDTNKKVQLKEFIKGRIELLK
jgi:protein subunit release factor A